MWCLEASLKSELYIGFFSRALVCGLWPQNGGHIRDLREILGL